MGKVFKWIGIVFVGLIILGIIANLFSDKKDAKASAAATTSTSTDHPADKPADKPSTAWSYSSDTDKMTSKVVYSASVPAKDEVQLKFPYNGGASASINVRSKNGGNDVYLYVSKGQLMAANPVEGGSIKVRFDQNSPESFSVSGPSDGSSNYLFITASSKFLSQLKTAKHLLVEAEFYQDGEQQMEFNTENFDWGH